MTISKSESRLGSLYRRLYDCLCGKHPNLRPWHFQWLDTRELYKTLRPLLLSVQGGAQRRVLDVGCGEKPYRNWFGSVAEYVGADVVPGANVDIVIHPRESWPLPSDHFHVILCTQVLEHVEDLTHTCSEIQRVLKPGGILIVSFPFLYNEHGAPWDFRRFTVYSAQHLFPLLRLESVYRQGGIGSTVIILTLNWLENTLNLTFFLRLIKGLMLPVYLLVAVFGNFVGLMWDRLDRTQAFYSNILTILRKELPESIPDDY